MKLSKLRANTSMRKLAGTTIPRQDTTSFGMRNALKRAAGGRCMGDVDGKPMRPSLAKPGRKRGGSVHKFQDGGAEKSPPNPGEVSDEASGKYLRKKANDARSQAGHELFFRQSPAGWNRNANKAVQADREADKFEPKKHGGRAYAKGGRVGKFKDGGADKSPPNPGEVSDKDSAKYLRGKASEKAKESDADYWKGLGSTAAGSVGTALATKVPILGRGSGIFAPQIAGAGYGTKKMVDAISKGSEASTLKDEADKFDKAGKRWGGRAKRKAKDNDGDQD